MLYFLFFLYKLCYIVTFDKNDIYLKVIVCFVIVFNMFYLLVNKSANSHHILNCFLISLLQFSHQESGMMIDW